MTSYKIVVFDVTLGLHDVQCYILIILANLIIVESKCLQMWKVGQL